MEVEAQFVRYKYESKVPYLKVPNGSEAHEALPYIYFNVITN